ncbi:MAG: hypothetical protein Tsb0015_17050 [Simkaniaceae bacterium]
MTSFAGAEEGAAAFPLAAAPVWTLISADPEEVSCYVQEFLQSRFNASAPHVVKLNGEKCTIDEIASMTAPSLFPQERNILWISSMEKISSSGKKMIYEYLENNLGSSPALILTGAKLGIFADIAKKFPQKLALWDFSKEKKWEKRKRVQEFLMHTLRHAGKSIDQKALQALIGEGNEDLPRLVLEVEKLICYAGGKTAITYEMLQKISVFGKACNIWKISEQVVFGQDAGKQGPMPFDVEKEFFSLLAQFRYQTDIGLLISLSQNGEADLADLQKEYPHIKGSLLNHYLKLITNLTKAYFIEAKKILFEVEYLAKQSNAPFRIWYFYLLAKLKILRECNA